MLPARSINPLHPLFSPGSLYSHDEIYRKLHVGNAGGVRFATADDGTTVRGVLFTSVPAGRVLYENPYHDRIENDVLVYTAQGKTGDQGFGGINQRLLLQPKQRFPLYCFQLIASRRDKAIGVKRWKFLGLLSYLRHYKEMQSDVAGVARMACIIEFNVLANFAEIDLASEQDIFHRLFAENTTRNDGQSDETELLPTHLFDTGETPEHLEKIRFAMLALHPKGFEDLIRETLTKSGFENVYTTRYSQDGGIDVNAFVGESIWPLRNLHLQVQAKRWMHSVGRKEIAELRGSLARHARGALITTSFFSKSAIAEAQHPEKLPIVAMDGYDFARIVNRLNIQL